MVDIGHSHGVYEDQLGTGGAHLVIVFGWLVTVGYPFNYPLVN